MQYRPFTDRNLLGLAGSDDGTQEYRGVAPGLPSDDDVVGSALHVVALVVVAEASKGEEELPPQEVVWP